MAEVKVHATGETKKCPKCGEVAMIVLKNGTVNGGLSYWNYLAIDLPVGQLVMCDHSQTRKVPEYPGTIRDYGAIRDFDGARALRHAFVEWVYNRTEAVRN